MAGLANTVDHVVQHKFKTTLPGFRWAQLLDIRQVCGVQSAACRAELLVGDHVTSIHARVRRGPMVVERKTINLTAPTPGLGASI